MTVCSITMSSPKRQVCFKLIVVPGLCGMSNVIVRSSFAFHGVMSTSSVVFGEHVSEMGPMGGTGMLVIH